MIVIRIRVQRYDENPDGTILKTECSAVGNYEISTETLLIKSRYLYLMSPRFREVCFRNTTIALCKDLQGFVSSVLLV